MSVTDLPDYTGYSDIENVYGDVKIYTPSGLWVVGSDIITGRFATGTLLIGGGEEDIIFDSMAEIGECRGRIRQLGIGLYDCIADPMNDGIIRIYLDDDYGTTNPTMEIYLVDIDLLNGGEIYRRSRYGLYDATFTEDTTTYEVYYAKTSSARGAVTYAVRDASEPWRVGWVAASAWISLDCEWLSKVEITLRNKNATHSNTLYGHAVILYGLYP